MQAVLRKINSSGDFSFTARTDKLPRLYDKWHFHPELELTHIVESKGTRFVGDSIEEFEDGDVVLLGGYLPHVWINDSDYYIGDPRLNIAADVLQFLPDCLGKTFFDLREMEAISRLFERAKRGLRIVGSLRIEIVQLLNHLVNTKNGPRRVALFLEILYRIAESEEVVFLSSEIFMESYHRSETDSIGRVYDFTLSQFGRKILIGEVAAIANMSIANFCRYFKNRTHKTYIQLLTEVRIGYACRMLIENKKSIQQIAFDCGFNNLSNFNRAFKAMKNQQPTEFRRAFANMGAAGV
jgi:AraC-like DNA-binding protein